MTAVPALADWAHYAKFLLAVLVIVNPVGAMPIFIGLTARDSDAQRRHIARRASLSAGIVLSVAALGGQPLLAIFGISLASFKVGGAILILLLAISMMHAVPTTEKQTPEEAREAEDKESVGVVPLAVPLLAGPGAISTTIIYAGENNSWMHVLAIIVCCQAAALVIWAALRVAVPAHQWLGTTGVNIAVRIMGLLLAAVAVELFAGGMLELFPGLR